MWDQEARQNSELIFFPAYLDFPLDSLKKTSEYVTRSFVLNVCLVFFLFLEIRNEYGNLSVSHPPLIGLGWIAVVKIYQWEAESDGQLFASSHI